MLTDLVFNPYSKNHHFRLRLIRQFHGQTICVGIFIRGRGQNKTSRLLFFLCRSILHDSEATVSANNEAQLDDVTVRLTACRYQIETWKVKLEYAVHLIPICNFVRSLRKLKSRALCHGFATSNAESSFWDIFRRSTSDSM